MNDLETRVRETLEHQAALLVPPPLGLDDLGSRPVAPNPGPGPRARVLALAAAAVIVLGAVVLVNRSGDPDEVAVQPRQSSSTGPVEGAPAAAAAFRFATPQVRLEATEMAVRVQGRTFRPSGPAVGALEPPPGSVGVHGDPGASDYTTLELTWFEHGVEMRIFVYFASDGSDWWVSEIRTYDGEVAGDWIDEMGPFMRTPLGRAFEGDFEAGPLRIEGLRLEAFLDPVAAARPPMDG